MPEDFHAAWRSWMVGDLLAVGIVISVAGSFGAARRAARVRPLDGVHADSGDQVMTIRRWAIDLVRRSASTVMTTGAEQDAEKNVDADHATVPMAVAVVGVVLGRIA